ncbi:MAG: diadenylate cyclase CdaA [Planctomycetota bacterium]
MTPPLQILPAWLNEELLRAALEILIFTGFFYLILKFLLETRGSGVIRGLTILITSVFIASVVLIETFQLSRLEVVFNNLVNTAVLGLIIVFQPEIRRGITHLGDQQMIGRLFGKWFKRDSEVMEQVLIACRNLGKARVGAIIAIEQVASLTQYAHGGTQLDTKVDHMLLETIFFPGSPLHDGAVVMQDDRVIGAGAVLPLSRNEEISKRLGTRHRAALGLAEECDALVIVVSEETGAISVATQGRLHYDLREDELRAFLGLGTDQVQPAEEAKA